jgi:hypothetical protein
MQGDVCDRAKPREDKHNSILPSVIFQHYNLYLKFIVSCPHRFHKWVERNCIECGLLAYSQSIVQYSQFIVQYSQFIAQYSQFIVQYSQFTVQYSQFIVQYSQFTVQYLQFIVQYSQFIVQYSQFTVQYSQFIDYVFEMEATSHWLTFHCLCLDFISNKYDIYYRRQQQHVCNVIKSY